MLNIWPFIPVLFPPQLVGEQVLVLLLFPPGISSEALTADGLLPAPFFVQLLLRCELQKLSVAGNVDTQARAYEKKHSVTQCKNIFHNLKYCWKIFEWFCQNAKHFTNLFVGELRVFSKDLIHISKNRFYSCQLQCNVFQNALLWCLPTSTNLASSNLSAASRCWDSRHFLKKRQAQNNV